MREKYRHRYEGNGVFSPSPLGGGAISTIASRSAIFQPVFSPAPNRKSSATSTSLNQSIVRPFSTYELPSIRVEDLKDLYYKLSTPRSPPELVLKATPPTPPAEIPPSPRVHCSPIHNGFLSFPVIPPTDNSEPNSNLLSMFSPSTFSRTSVSSGFTHFQLLNT
eukprot:NODE_7924_length_728_cov_29.342149_g7308_i0.p1 GENE.NODE_7924_length_728_cov_29.342149_g7308_i0~~NODE_7924_length_728_cov_29.342149_g7308_i0.p1  ORF type:complete len:180 (-),score=33.22 NODE_7924_length_728_cov_29.342149_g7308_i0:188-679(-)